MGPEPLTITIEGPLTADAIVDAHLRALEAGRPLTILHEGEPTRVALRTAERFGVALVARKPSFVDPGSPQLPWDPAQQAPEPPAPISLPEDEFEAMPWNLVDNVILPSSGRHTRIPSGRPTLTAPDWGLPWPRPAAPMDGLAKADPRIWQAPERIQAIREDLERAGAPSFGAVKPEGSAWLKRLSEFGSP